MIRYYIITFWTVFIRISSNALHFWVVLFSVTLRSRNVVFQVSYSVAERKQFPIHVCARGVHTDTPVGISDTNHSHIRKFCSNFWDSCTQASPALCSSISVGSSCPTWHKARGDGRAGFPVSPVRKIVTTWGFWLLRYTCEGVCTFIPYLKKAQLWHAQLM